MTDVSDAKISASRMQPAPMRIAATPYVVKPAVVPIATKASD
jgi:hypothetical protein